MTWEPADIEFRRTGISDDGTNLVGLLSWPTHGESCGLVVLPPGYERRMHHYAVLSYLFVKHGYTTLRFDLRNHIGYSDGDIVAFTMSSVAADIAAALTYASREHPNLKQYILAPSLAARGAMRTLANREAPAGLVALMPVVDVRHTIAQVAGEDLISKWETGEVTDPSRLFLISKHQIAASFGQDAVEQDWGGVVQAQREMSAIDCPIYAIAAEHDEWVRAEDVQLAFSGENPWPRQCTVMEASSHDIARNIPVLRLMLELALRGVNALEGREEEPELPDFSEFVDVVTTERRWAMDEYRSLPVKVGAQS